jgi:uncharacterized protein YkwD
MKHIHSQFRLLALSAVLALALSISACGGGGPSLTDNTGNNFPPGTNHGTATYNPPIVTPTQEVYADHGSWKASCLDTVPTAIYQNDSLALWAQRIFDGVNSSRSANSAGILARSHNLDRIAQAQARDMALRNYFAHATPDGIMPWDRVDLAQLKDYSMIVDGQLVSSSAGKATSDISYGGCGENAARGQLTTDEVVSGWMNSPGHRANMLNVKYNYVGTGVYFDPSDTAMPMHIVQLYLEGRL